MAVDDSTHWLTIKIDRSALMENISVFRQLVDPDTKLMAVVKADAYGHGLLLAAEAFLAGGADQLGVHSLDEARGLREGGIQVPILILGPLTTGEVGQAVELGVEDIQWNPA